MRCNRAVICTVIVLVFASGSLGAQSATVERVTLFTSGIAEFRLSVPVVGNQVVPLDVPREAMSDVVRSLTVIDGTEGSTYQITYPGGQELSTQLSRYRVNLAEVRSTLDLANQVRGYRVVVGRTDGEALTGEVVAVDPTHEGAIGEVVIATDQRLERVPADEIAFLEIVDDSLRGDLSRAVQTLATGEAASRTRRILIDVRGRGSREVAIRYLTPMPIWKTSYRAVVDGGALTLQGWAHIDNTTNLDWSGVTVTLVSASPNSYFFDLYPPREVAREQMMIGPAMPFQYGKAEYLEHDFAEERAFATQAAPSAIGNPTVAASSEREETGVVFVLDQPVTVPRGGSVMVPIVNQRIDAQTIRSFDPRYGDSSPQVAVRFTNQTANRLPEGPITLFDRGRYVGDAYLSTLPAGGTSILPYADDLAYRVMIDNRRGESEIATARIVDGLLVTERRLRYQTRYTINYTGSPRERAAVEIAHPRRAGWEIVSPKPQRREGSMAFFSTTDGELEVMEEQLQEQRYQFGGLDETVIAAVRSSDRVEREVLRVIDTIAELQRQLREATDARERAERGLSQIASDQERIRGNMANLERRSNLYQRYVNELTVQEGELEILRDELKDAGEAELQASSSRDAYLRSLGR